MSGQDRPSFKLKNHGMAVIGTICTGSLAGSIIWFFFALIQSGLSLPKVYHDWSHPLSWWKIALVVGSVGGVALWIFVIDTILNGSEQRSLARQLKHDHEQW